MKQRSFPSLWVSLFMATLALLLPETLSAAGATSAEINKSIVQTGSIPLTWENDTKYPWSIIDGKLSTTDSASVKFNFTSQYPTTISFKHQNNYYSISQHLYVIVDGEQFYHTYNNYDEQARLFRLPKGNHTVEIKSVLDNANNPYKSSLWDVKVEECPGASVSEINESIVLPGSVPLTWILDNDCPWQIIDGRLKSNHYNYDKFTLNKTSSISFKYSSQYPTTISFKHQNNYYSISQHLYVIVDGEQFYHTYNNYDEQARLFRLPKGNHTVEIKSVLDNANNPYKSSLWDVKVEECPGATSYEINKAIVQEGSVPLTWTQDEGYPWTINDETSIRSGNFGFKNSSSSISFSYQSDNPTEIIFDVKKNDYSPSNYHAIHIYLDGAFKSELGNYNNNNNSVSYRVPRGSHTVQIVDTINNHEDFQDYTILKNVSVIDRGSIENALLTSKSRPMHFIDEGSEPWYIEGDCVKSNSYVASNSYSTLSSIVTVDKPTKLSFRNRVGYDYTDSKFCFYINDEAYYTSNNTNWNYISVVLQPGTYTLKWEYTNKYSGNSYYALLQEIELSDECVDVEITPGMLGVEVLYKVNVLTDAEMLKINGILNDSDWATIKMMTNLKYLDLSEAKVDKIAANQFSSLKHLNSVVLPEGVTAIGDKAFVGTNIYYLTIPSTVESIGREAFANTRITKINFEDNSKLISIGYQAFYRCKELKEFIMPNSVTSLECYDSSRDDSSTFYECSSLRKISFSDSLTYLPNNTCYENNAVEELHLPNNLITIGDRFMYGANSLKDLHIPVTVQYIGEHAFAGLHQIEHLILPEKLNSTIGSEAFSNSANLKIVEIPTSVGLLYGTFRGCAKIEKIICRAATPPTVSNDAFSSANKANVTLEVPSFALATYKLDPYWYQFGNIIEGEPTDYWKVIGDLKLLNNRRMEGKPDVDLYYGGKLTVKGDAAMPMGKFDIYTSTSNPSSFVTDCPNVTAEEINILHDVSANSWHFLTPMADIDLRHVIVNGSDNYVFRYYDGATRADIGAGTSWKNVSDMKLKAGVGYIFQCDKASTVTFPVPVELHKNVLTNEDVTLPLMPYPSDNKANKGWNYVGNPFPSYFDIHYMDFTAPITVWTGSTYKAYSITDDNYVLRPMQGFFVQKPDAGDKIVLRSAGRQIESTVNRPIGAPSFRSEAENGERSVIDIEIAVADVSDMTRIVINERASEEYELEYDAAKFMSHDESVPQIFTIDKGNNRLAINERPLLAGNIPLGVFIPDGNEIYTVSYTGAENDICLYDAETEILHDLSERPYSFNAPKGIDSDRFTVILGSDITSGTGNSMSGKGIAIHTTVEGIEILGASDQLVKIINVNGNTVYSETSKRDKVEVNLPSGIYVVVIDNRSHKVIVK